MTLEEITNFIHNKAVEFGHNELVSIPVERNNRLKSCLGRCYTTYDNGEWYASKIQLSGTLLDSASNEDIQQVALHELSHAFVAHEYQGQNVASHGKEFKEICDRIGCTHKEAANSVKFNETVMSNAYNYVVECPECGEK